MDSFKQRYLVVYNIICFCLWGYVGFLVLFAPYGGLVKGLNPIQLWSVLQPWVSLVQSLAILECIHSACGLVRSPFATTFMQVASRLHIVWIIWRLCPTSIESVAMVTAIGAWSAVECIRYPFYAINTVTTVPNILKWLRYSAFIILYPIGISSEVRCIWLSLGYLKNTAALRSYPYPMPNLLNFEVDLYMVYIFICLMYIPGSVYLYSHMIKQRNSALSKTADKQL